MKLSIVHVFVAAQASALITHVAFGKLPMWLLFLPSTIIGMFLFLIAVIVVVFPYTARITIGDHDVE